jgi:hypothetical protein
MVSRPFGDGFGERHGPDGFRDVDGVPVASEMGEQKDFVGRP